MRCRNRFELVLRYSIGLPAATAAPIVGKAQKVKSVALLLRTTRSRSFIPAKLDYACLLRV